MMLQKSKLSVIWILITFISYGHSLKAQDEADIQHPSVDVHYIADPIKIDGVLDDTVWSNIEAAKDMHQNFPDDKLSASYDTEVSMAYDDNNLYIAITCHAQGGDFITTSLKRDYDFFGNDNVTLLLDTYNDRTNALVFGMNAYGVRREATVVNAGQSPSDFDESWDNKWIGEAKRYADRWTVEMAIPFSTLRFKNGTQKWRFNMYRVDTQSNEITSFTDIPRNRFVMDMGFMGDMNWEKPLKQTGKNISLIPYVASAVTRDFEDQSQLKAQGKFNIGGDAKIGISSGLNLDLTFNPDFSQVEVDEQVTNLDRFEILFPERRQFFLENADLFGSFSGRFSNPFFSRRIGVSIDPKTGQNIQNTILYGARLSGKLNERLRLGLLNMQTASIEGLGDGSGTPAFNYTVATAEQRISDISRVQIMGVNKQAISPSDYANSDFNDYNRLMGLAYRLNNKSNEWVANANIQKTFTPDISGDDIAHTLQVVHNKRKYRLEWAHILVGNNYNPEVGFSPRKDFFIISPEAQVNFFPKSGPIASHSVGFDSRIFWKLGKDDNPYIEDFAVEEINFDPTWDISFRDLSMLNVSLSYKDLTLLNDFDPTRLQEDDIFLSGGTSYSYLESSISYSSDQRKRVTSRTEVNYGSYFNGSRYGLSGSLTYRYQPYGFVSLGYSYNHVALAEPFKAVDIWLIGPRIDLTFSKKIFLTTFIQYNNQLDNLNINARFQWRFAPVSDFFIVYTDNYDTAEMANFGSRNRALVAKMTYWFNL